MNFRNKIIAFVSIFAIVFILIAPAFASDDFDGGQLGAGRSTVVDFYGFLGGRHEAGDGRFSSKDAYDNYVSTLDTTTATYAYVVSGYSCQLLVSNVSPCYVLMKIGYKYPNETSAMLQSLGVNSKVAIFNGRDASLYGFFFDDSGIFSFGEFVNPFGKYNASQLGVWSLNDLSLIGSAFVPVCWGSRYYNYPIFYSKAYAEAYSDFLYSTVLSFYWDDLFMASDSMGFYKKNSTDATWLSGYSIYSLYSSTYNFTLSGVNSTNIIWDSSYCLDQPTGTDSTSRPASLMQTINNYNIDNSITDNSTNINYYIGTVDASNNITNVYSPNLFDEGTLVFTEPVSGVQYTCVGWKYYYDQRAYVLELADNAMSYEGTDIKYLVLMYGDDNVTVAGYSSETTPDNLDFVFSDSYAYVVASGSECSLYGHTNTVETICEPTCTTSGQYKYTCTVCGNEEIVITEAAGHTFVYSVLRDASCSAEGLGLYSCSVCGAEYTESIPALAHTYEIREVVDAKYDEDGNLLSPAYTVYACTVCGDEYLDYTGDGVITDSSGNWSWLKKWLTEFKAWLGEKLGLISGDTIINDYDTSVDITQDNGVDYNITYEDGSGQEQTTSIKEIVGKFAFIGDIYTIGDTLISVVTADAAAAYALDNNASESDYSIMTDGVPTLTVDLGAAESKYGYVYGGQVTVLDLSWYAPYKETVDNLISGFLWLLFCWHLFKTAPGILGGVGLTTERLEDISDGERKKGGRKK